MLEQDLARPMLVPEDGGTYFAQWKEMHTDEKEKTREPRQRLPFSRKTSASHAAKEVQEHIRTHIPSRSCCAHCTRRWGGRTTLHRTGEAVTSIRTSPSITGSSSGTTMAKTMDRSEGLTRGSCQPSSEEGRSTLTLAMAVPGKGTAALWTAKRVAVWFDKPVSHPEM